MRQVGIEVLDCSAALRVERALRISVGTYRQNEAMLVVFEEHDATSDGLG